MAELLKQIIPNSGNSGSHQEEYQLYLGWLKGHPDILSLDLSLDLDDHYHFWNKLSGHNRGLLTSPQHDRDEALTPSMPWIVALDSFRSGYNVGSIFRISDAFGFSKVILGGHSPGPANASVKSSAMGAEAFIDHLSTPSLKDFVQSYRTHHTGKVIAVEVTPQATPIHHFSFPREGLIILGNEERGIHPEILALSHEIVSIPMYGRKNSLNVASAFSIIAQKIRETDM